MAPAPEISPAGRRGLRAWTFAIALIAAGWTAAMFPVPRLLLSEHGQGYQLAAALEILHGRHPVLDFRETYGPLTFYFSAIAQWLGRGRVIGEFTLVVLAFSVSYAVLFRLLVASGAKRWIATALTLAAIVAQPEGYRYYLLLWPLIILLAAWRYVGNPSRGRLALLGLAITVAGLFRPDLGAYGFVTGLVLIFASDQWPRARRAGELALWVFLWALPWLLWLAWHGKLGEYLMTSSFEASLEAAGRAKPAPWPDFSAGLFTAQTAKVVMFRLPLLMLVFAGIMLFVRRATLRGPQRAWLFAAFTLAALMTLLASHIVDWIHVRDTFAVRFALLGWIVASAGVAAGARAAQWLRRWSPLLVVGSFAAAAMVVTLTKERTGTFAPRALAAKMSDYCRTSRDLLAHVRPPTFRVQLYEYVRDHSGPDETVLAVLESPQMNYFADRRFAARQMAIFPGYFARPEQQQRLIAELREGPTAFVVVDDYVKIEYPEMALERFAPDLKRFLDEEFVEVTRVDYCRVLAPRWRKRVR